MKKLKVLQGFIDIGGQASRYSRALQQQGYLSECWAYEQVLKDEPVDKRLNFRKDGLLNGRFRKLGYFIEALSKFDIWHIHKGFSLFHNVKDLEWAKKTGKGVIIHYRGREIRPQMDLVQLPNVIVNKVLREQEIADLIFVKDGQLAKLIAPYVRQPIVFPNIVDVSKLKTRLLIPDDYYDEKRKLRVVHVPSNPLYKGTEFIREAMKKIASDIDYIELAGLSHTALLEHYWKADIVIDQVLTGTYGNASLEAMALGRCVVNHLDETFMAYEPEYPPIINSDRFHLTDVIAELSVNRKRIWEAGEKGRAFTLEHHSFDGVGRKLIDYYQNII